MPKMDNSCDFIYWLSPDMSIEILTHLDDPSDLVRVSAVSRLWHRFVIENGLCGQLCLKMLPEVSNAANVINNKIEPLKVNVNSTVEWECLRKRHRVYSFLARGLSPVVRKDCISEAISASSTDNYPEESIQNTLEPRDRIQNRASYWSSKGERDPAVPEILLYKLIAKLSVITEIHVQPFQAYFQYGFPIYSPRAIRFRVGHLQNQVEFGGDVANSAAANAFIWTYTSPEFPMVQENSLQKFELPEAALCIGGFLAVELLGRVQRQEIDGLYYICVLAYISCCWHGAVSPMSKWWVNHSRRVLRSKWLIILEIAP
ncbi:F-box protein At4g00755 isoform X2 [Ziziphus jujuba]|uniref:F-box protein At4g00755 isoform X2 n=1 Tax=Ziziphus jujuba TaxID=326968 RepID=A0ABM4AGN9_ZIZJJ|nr:F-box protein At4g00755 isoform X2 [Ziziphus jujuba]